MRIGILKAGTVHPDVGLRYGDYPDMFHELLVDPAARPAGAPAPEFLDVDVARERLPDPTACDAYLVTGSRHSVYDDLPWIAPLAEFAARALQQRRRVVGICFGHQLIAHHFGGETRAAPAGWCVGVHRARVVDAAPWMDPPAADFALLVSHRDQVVRLPTGARTFAVADACPVAGFVLGDALAFQGHPEFVSGYAGALMDARRRALGEDVYRAGKASLREHTDGPLVARWIWRFMSQGAG